MSGIMIQKVENQELTSMDGVEISYIRLSGNGIQGRWYFSADWKGRVFHIEHQPNSLKFSRAGVLKDIHSKETVKGKISTGLHQKTIKSLVTQISARVKEVGLYPKLRRSEAQLIDDMNGFIASVVLQNCHPPDEFIELMVKRTKAYMEGGFIKPSQKRKSQWYFGSNIEGWWYMTEVPA